VTIHTYIIEEPSTPEDFKELLFTSVKEKNLYLTVSARPMPDDLSIRRSSDEELEEELKKFTFRVYEIHPDPEDFFLNAQDATTKKWVHITVAEKVSFTLTS